MSLSYAVLGLINYSPMTGYDLKKIFDRFYRADPSRSTLTGGSGLGLSIVQSCLHSLGGQVEIQSELNKGTQVTITLPLK